MSGTDLRNLVHMAAGGLCLTLAWLPPAHAVLVAAGFVAFNLWVMPRLASGRLRRPGESWGPSDRGLVLYPLAVLVLLILLPARPTVVAGAWAMLAFGDGAASILGRHLGGPTLPWNRSKSLAGALAFLLCGGAAVGALLHLSALAVVPFRDAALLDACRSLSHALAVGSIAAALAAVLESLPGGVDDNLTVPWASAALLLGLTAVSPRSLAEGALEAARLWPPALGLTLAAGIVAYLLRWVSFSGLVGGVCVGTAIALGLGWWGFGLLLAFFLMGSAATQIGFASKQERGIAQEEAGARSSVHALANGAVPALCALFALAGSGRAACALAFAGAVGAAAFDTVASEVGKWLGGPTVVLERLEAVLPGTPGGVSLAGTLAGAAAGALVAALASAGGLVPSGWGGTLTVWLASAVGAFSERPLTLLGSSGRPHPEMLNLLNTLAGAAAALSGGGWLLEQAPVVTTQVGHLLGVLR